MRWKKDGDNDEKYAKPICYNCANLGTSKAVKAPLKKIT